MLMYIERTAAAMGAIAATLVATAAPQPFFGMAFWLYVVSAMMAAYVMKKQGNIGFFLLFIYYIGIDSYGIYTWWPW